MGFFLRFISLMNVNAFLPFQCMSGIVAVSKVVFSSGRFDYNGACCPKLPKIGNSYCKCVSRYICSLICGPTFTLSYDCLLSIYNSFSNYFFRSYASTHFYQEKNIWRGPDLNEWEDTNALNEQTCCIWSLWLLHIYSISSYNINHIL